MEMIRPRALAWLCLCAGLWAGVLAFSAEAGDKNAAYAIVEGTVFHEPGLALPDAKVVLQLRDQAKSKKQEAVTNYRGEFQFRVPATAAVYVVKATMKGFHPDQKDAAIAGGAAAGQERVTINLVLAPESK